MRNNDDHLFLSYTRTPDAGLAREAERFLESFHTSEAPRRVMQRMSVAGERPA